MQMLGSQADFQELKHHTFTLSIHANPNYFRRRLNVYSISVVCYACREASRKAGMQAGRKEGRQASRQEGRKKAGRDEGLRTYGHQSLLRPCTSTYVQSRAEGARASTCTVPYS